MGRFVASKTFDHNEGLTCAYRYWKSEGKRRFLHGYALNIRLVFECVELDESSKVLKEECYTFLKDWLDYTFGFTTCVAEDDPQLETFKSLHDAGAINLRIMPDVGCERFAEMIWHRTHGWLMDQAAQPRVNIRTVEVRENQSHSYLYLE